jgi:hypothetical protein
VANKGKVIRSSAFTVSPLPLSPLEPHTHTVDPNTIVCAEHRNLGDITSALYSLAEA